MTIRVTAVLEDGHAFIHDNGNVVFQTWRGDGEAPIITHRLGKHDLCELLRLACGSDHEVLRVLSQNMQRGHRFTLDENGETDLRFADEDAAF